MRCATCGTENAPDSRFCGGCGAKLASASRVAPTAKITDDASYPSQPPQNASIPPQNNYASGPASIPPQNHAPASIPPQNAYPAVPGSIPPSNNPASIPQNSFQRAATPIQTPPPGSVKMPTPAPGSLSFAATPRLDQTPTTTSPPAAAAEASRSIVVPPRRPIGLIVFVLLVDLALAGAGAVLLGKGLSEKKPAAKPEQKTQRDRAPQTDAPTNVEARASNIDTSSGVKPAVAPQTSAAPQTSTPKSTPTATPKAASAKTSASAPTPTQKPAPAPTATPDPAPPAPAPAPEPAPPPEVSFDTQLERATTASKGAFDRCAADAGSPHGTVRIAFRVLEDGSVANAFPVEDSTGTSGLGQCLAQTITTWRFTPHTGAPINSLRAFNYP